MVTHSSILGWTISWTEEPGGLQFIGWQRHDSATEHTHTHTHTHTQDSKADFNPWENSWGFILILKRGH